MTETDDQLVAGAKAAPIHRLFEQRVALAPDAPALFDDSACLGYGELNAQANRLARYLVGRGVRPGARVALCIPRSRDTVVSLLAILKAGAAVVPMDMTLPEARKQAILDDARPAALIAADDGLGIFAEPVVVLPEARADVARERPDNLDVVSPEATLGVHYTSGVTGRPKGVSVPAPAVLHHMFWMWRTFPLQTGDVGLLHRSTMLISSTWDYLGLLLHGTPSVLVPEADSADTAALYRRVQAHGVSHVSGAPAFWESLLDQVERRHGEWHTLRLGTISGEQVSVRVVRRWQRAFPTARLLNVYGSTECVRPTVYDTTHLPADAERVPVGTPLPAVRVFVVDEQLRPMPAGEAGEICVSGPCVTDGYLGQPQLTAERFVRAPGLTGGDEVVFRTGDVGRVLPDGTLEVSGRRDQQVKIRGFRVELGDVETALLRFDGVRQVAVLATEVAHAGKCLVAYLVRDDDRPLPPGALREFLASKLPDYMIPAFFVPLEELPLTRSGKTDWSALPAPSVPVNRDGTTDPDALAPTERSVLAIWREVFGLPDLGCDDDFFVLGGHSVLAMQIASRVMDAFGVELSMEAWQSQATVRSLARRIDAASHGTGSPGSP